MDQLSLINAQSTQIGFQISCVPFLDSCCTTAVALHSAPQLTSIDLEVRVFSSCACESSCALLYELTTKSESLAAARVVSDLKNDEAGEM